MPPSPAPSALTYEEVRSHPKQPPASLTRYARPAGDQVTHEQRSSLQLPSGRLAVLPHIMVRIILRCYHLRNTAGSRAASRASCHLWQERRIYNASKTIADASPP